MDPMAWIVVACRPLNSWMVPAFASDFFIMIVIIMVVMIVGGTGICARIVRMMMKRVPTMRAQDLPSSARARSQL
jgi:hypothetical protein